jgi:DNA helicase-2/ATP-dependent DNA helicase PcrA
VAEHDTLKAIQACLDAQESFVVEAGAGSGKTRSLIETVQSLLATKRIEFEKANRRLVCITFTNVAKNEIMDRLNGDTLVLVDTIHEFLWKVIAPFQRELRLEVLAQNASAKAPLEGLEELLRTQHITYGQYGRHFDRGELHHNDVISIAGALFEKYPKITRVAADQYPFIFVDEYQDTSQTVVDLLLNFFVKNPRKPVVGFFGDSMQQIYDSNVTDVAGQHGLTLITKTENYRCSIAVIDVLNRLRTDLEQEPTGENKPGDVHLMTSSASAPRAYEVAMTQLEGEGWTLDNTKILMLTHKGIAREIGYADLLAAFALRSFGAEQLTEREDELGELFTFVEGLGRAYNNKKYGQFLELLGQSGVSIKAVADKAEIASEMAKLDEARATGIVSDVITVLDSSSRIPLPRRIRKLLSRLEADPSDDDESFAKRRASYEATLAVRWDQVQKFVDYADEHTPFSTKHGVKGAEFENVLVMIDDSLWNQFKFAQVFTDDHSNERRLQKSRKLLYVCFSRAMSGLAVLCLGPMSADEIAGAEALLGVASAEIQGD